MCNYPKCAVFSFLAVRKSSVIKKTVKKVVRKTENHSIYFILQFPLHDTSCIQTVSTMNTFTRALRE